MRRLFAKLRNFFLRGRADHDGAIEVALFEHDPDFLPGLIVRAAIRRQTCRRHQRRVTAQPRKSDLNTSARPVAGNQCSIDTTVLHAILPSLDMRQYNQPQNAGST